MHVQIVKFNLNCLTEAEYRQRADDRAHLFADIPGLISKTWLADTATNTYGGVYLWQDRPAMEAYVRGPVFQAVRADPNFANLTTIDFDVLAAPSRVTRGLAAVAV